MSNELVKQGELTQAQIELIRKTVARDATNDELKLFLYRAESLGLDPLKPGQIYFIKYGNSPGTIVVGIDGFRAKAVRTGKLSGIKRGVLRNDKGQCIGAWAEIYRSDWQHPAREEVNMQEYNTGKHNWLKMPETMIKKVAECAALRMAFPDDLGGVYAPEEMGQAQEANDSINRQHEVSQVLQGKKNEVVNAVDISPAETVVEQIKEKVKPKKRNRGDIVADLMTEIKRLSLSKEEIAEWANNLFHKEDLKSLTLDELEIFLADMSKEIAR